jgi:cytochrome b involved in lipid metabolism
MSEKMKITAQDLRDHCCEKSAWIAIRGKVYDVTSFIERHPGGKDQLRYGEKI